MGRNANESPIYDPLVAIQFFCNIAKFYRQIKIKNGNKNLIYSPKNRHSEIESFRRDYNSYRPHSSLQGMTPEEAETEYVKNPEFSTFELSEKGE